MEPDVENAGVGQYALFQTEVYIPPRVVGGRIPKNAFGNLDVYVPSMVPPGAVHIRSREAKNAARLLKVDYADAVSGFQFKGRRGIAVVEGIVVASEYEDAINTTLEGFAHVRNEILEERRSLEALRLWKRFFVGLRIVERLKGYKGVDEVEEEERLATQQLHKEIEEKMAQYPDHAPEDSGGGFFVDQDDDAPAVPTALSYHHDANDHDSDLLPEDDESGGFFPETDEIDIQSPEEHLSFGLEHLDIPAAVCRSEDDGGGFPPEIDRDDRATRLPTNPSSMGSRQAGNSPPEHDAQMYSPRPLCEDPNEATNSHESQAEDADRKEVAIETSVSDRMDIDNNNGVSLETKKIQTAKLQELSGTEETQREAQNTLPSHEPFAKPLQELSPTPPNLLQPAIPPSFLERDDYEMISQPPGNIYDHGSIDERDSLPSEDPEDEDAEPEWLL